MSDFSAKCFPILFSKAGTKGLAKTIAEINVDALCKEYDKLMKVAPNRSAYGKRYFVGHDGCPSANNPGCASAKHLAIALWHLQAKWPRASGGWMRLLDYEVPLKASNNDERLGKIDLLGATNRGRPVIIELKVSQKNNSRGNTPLLALMQGLRYAAVVQANNRAIAAEARERYDIDVSDEPPIVQIMAPEDWWRGWFEMADSTRRAAGEWEPKLIDFLTELEKRLGILIECVSLQEISLADVTWDGHGPRLEERPPMHRVCLKMRQRGTVTVDYTGYEKLLIGHLWSWADRYHAGELDDGRRNGRPPVLRAGFESRAVLVPSNPTRAYEIVSAIPNKARHRWFRSFKSSQALTQSVFGGLGSFGCLGLLNGVTAECGRPAFLEDARGASLALEHNVRTLDEPRPTSIDVLLEAGCRRVAIECKLTERKFGACSRPRLKPWDRTFEEQHCNGDYRIQRGRGERCSLTEIGVRYWTYLPDLFDWPADRDLRPCPLSEVYQLARNALAATVTDRGISPGSGHVLIIYDARNPEYAVSGKAWRQYESVSRAIRIPGLIRRLSWQRLVGAFACVPELRYLLAGLEGKYGIVPE